MLYYILRIIILYQSTLFYVAAEMCVWQPSIQISPLSVGLTVALALPHELNHMPLQTISQYKSIFGLYYNTNQTPCACTQTNLTNKSLFVTT